MNQTGEGREQASPGDTLKQAPHGAVAESLLQASLESGLFLFPFAWTENVCEGALRTRRDGYVAPDHCDDECCENKMLSEEKLCLWNVRKSWQFIPHSLWQHSKWSIPYLFFYSWYEFLSPSLMKVIYFLGISSECLIGWESAHIDRCKYLAISWIKKMESHLKIVWVFMRMFARVVT